MPWDDDEDEDDEIEDDAGAAADSPAEALGHLIAERYDGDERFEAIDTQEPGPLEGEPIRVRMLLNPTAYFFVSVLEDELVVRVGFATDDEDLSKELDESATDTAGSLTEFLQAGMESDEELEFESSHFHDDVYYFASDIPFTRDADLKGRHLRDNVLKYLEGYMDAILGLIEAAGGEDEDEEE